MLSPLLQRLATALWYIRADAFHLLEIRAERGHELPAPPRDQTGHNAARPTEDYHGDPLPQMELRGDVAVIPVRGPLVKGATPSEKFYYGLAAYEDIAADLDAATAGARAAVLHVASPGGTVLGLDAVAQKVSALAAGGFPIFSFTDDQQCSAAEYLTAGCTARLATGDAILGSIGTMAGHVSFEAMLKKFGLNVSLFTSGKFKGMGHPAKDLTQEQADFMQQFVMDRAAEFKSHLTAHRPAVPAEAMQGQIFTGHQAAQNGLIDATVASLEDVLRLI